MSDSVIIAMIGLAQTIVAGAFLYQQKKQGAHIEEIKKQTNGMNKQLQEAAQAKGKLEGAQEQRDTDQKRP